MLSKSKVIKIGWLLLEQFSLADSGPFSSVRSYIECHSRAAVLAILPSLWPNTLHTNATSGRDNLCWLTVQAIIFQDREGLAGGELYQWWQKHGATSLFICHPPKDRELRWRGEWNLPLMNPPPPMIHFLFRKAPLPKDSTSSPNGTINSCSDTRSFYTETSAPTFALSGHWWGRGTFAGWLSYFRDRHF